MAIKKLTKNELEELKGFLKSFKKEMELKENEKGMKSRYIIKPAT